MIPFLQTLLFYGPTFALFSVAFSVRLYPVDWLECKFIALVDSPIFTSSLIIFVLLWRNVPFHRSFSYNSPHDCRPSSHSCALLTLFKSELSGSNFQAWVPKSSESIRKHAYMDSWLTLSYLILNAMSHYTRNSVNLLIVLSARPYNQNHTVDIQCLSVVYNLMHNTSIL